MLIHRNARPFFWPGDKKVCCLLVHGFTGSPSEMRVLGEYLREQGYAANAPLLPGHGTALEDMAATAWPDWYGAVEEEYLRLTREYEKVIPIGLSMGGLLVLHLAARQNAPGFAALSAPVFLAKVRGNSLPKVTADFVPKNIAPEQVEQDFAEGQFYYTLNPVQGVISLLELIEQVKAELPSIKAPALIMQSKADKLTDPASADYIYKHLGSTEKKIYWLKKSGHVVTLGQERESVFKNIEEFIRRLMNQKTER